MSKWKINPAWRSIDSAQYELVEINEKDIPKGGLKELIGNKLKRGTFKKTGLRFSDKEGKNLVPKWIRKEDK